MTHYGKPTGPGGSGARGRSAATAAPPPGRAPGRPAGLVQRRTFTYTSVMAVMTVSEARAALPEVLNRVEAGEEVTITRHGRAVAVIVRPDVLWPRPQAGDVQAKA